MFDSDERYHRDKFALDVAIRFMQREARTRTVRLWTGLTDERIRKLYRDYLRRDPRCAPRHRGRLPCQISFFMRTHRMQHETAVLASWFCLAGVLPERLPFDHLQTFTTPARGLLLCNAFDAYKLLVPTAHITFEHAVFLAKTLAQGEELRITGCCQCKGLIVVDGYVLHEVRCGHCAGRLPLVA